MLLLADPVFAATSVSGVVIDQYGLPISGAVVIDPVDGATDETDGDGRFTLTVTTDGIRVLEATAADHAPGRTGALALGGRINALAIVCTRSKSRVAVDHFGTTLTSDDHTIDPDAPPHVRLRVPPDALTTGQLAVQELDPSRSLPLMMDLPSGTAPVGMVAIFDEGVHFAVDATLELVNRAMLLPGTEVPAARFDRVLMAWVPAGLATVDAAGDYLTLAVRDGGVYIFALPVVMSSGLSAGCLQRLGFRRGWGQVHAIESGTWVADDRLVRELRVPQSTGMTIVPSLLYDSFAYSGHARGAYGYGPEAGATLPQAVNLGWAGPGSAERHDREGTSEPAVLMPVWPPVQPTPDTFQLSWHRAEATHLHGAVLAKSTVFGGPPVENTNVAAPWGVTEFSVTVDRSLHLTAQGDGLPRGWVWKGVPQLIIDPADPARVLYLRDARGRWTSRAGRMTVMAGGGGTSDTLRHGIKAVGADLSGVRAIAKLHGRGLLVTTVHTSGFGQVVNVEEPGLLLVMAGGGPADAKDGDHGRAVRLYNPSAAAPWRDGQDRRGTVIAETGKHRVWLLDGAGILHILAGTGAEGAGVEAVQGQLSALRAPAGVTATGDGLVYVADSGNHRVRMINSDGVIQTVAGNGANSGALGDGGDALAATLSNPGDLAIDPVETSADGSPALLIADRGHCLVRQLKDGVLTTVAGNGTCGSPTQNAALAATALPAQLRLAASVQGDIFVCGEGGSALWQIDRNSGQIGKILGGGAGGNGAPITTFGFSDGGALAILDDDRALVMAMRPAGGVRGVLVGWQADEAALDPDGTSGMAAEPNGSGWKVTHPGGAVELFDTAGRLIQRGEGADAVHYTWALSATDGVARLTGINADGQVEGWTMSYRAEGGLLESITSPTGVVTQVVIDAQDKLRLWGGTHATFAELAYDERGRLSATKRYDQRELRFSYDDLGLVHKVVFDDAQGLIATVYDAAAILDANQGPTPFGAALWMSVGGGPEGCPPEPPCFHVEWDGYSCTMTQTCSDELFGQPSESDSTPIFWLPTPATGGTTDGPCGKMTLITLPGGLVFVFTHGTAEEPGCSCAEANSVSTSGCLKCTQDANGVSSWQATTTTPGETICRFTAECIGRKKTGGPAGAVFSAAAECEYLDPANLKTSIALGSCGTCKEAEATAYRASTDACLTPRAGDDGGISATGVSRFDDGGASPTCTSTNDSFSACPTGREEECRCVQLPATPQSGGPAQLGTWGWFKTTDQCLEHGANAVCSLVNCYGDGQCGVAHRTLCGETPWHGAANTHFRVVPSGTTDDSGASLYKVEYKDFGFALPTPGGNWRMILRQDGQPLAVAEAPASDCHVLWHAPVAGQQTSSGTSVYAYTYCKGVGKSGQGCGVVESASEPGNAAQIGMRVAVCCADPESWNVPVGGDQAPYCADKGTPVAAIATQPQTIGTSCQPCDPNATVAPSYWLLRCAPPSGIYADRLWQYVKANGLTKPTCHTPQTDGSPLDLIQLAGGTNAVGVWAKGLASGSNFVACSADKRPRLLAPCNLPGNTNVTRCLAIPPPAVEPILCDWSPACVPDTAETHCDPLRACTTVPNGGAGGLYDHLSRRLNSDGAPLADGGSNTTPALNDTEACRGRCAYQTCESGRLVSMACQTHLASEPCMPDVLPAAEPPASSGVQLAAVCEGGACAQTMLPNVADLYAATGPQMCASIPLASGWNIINLPRMLSGNPAATTCDMSAGAGWLSAPSDAAIAVLKSDPSVRLGPAIRYYVGGVSANDQNLDAPRGSSSNPFGSVFEALTSTERIRCVDVPALKPAVDWLTGLVNSNAPTLALIAPKKGEGTPEPQYGVSIQLVVRNLTTSVDGVSVLSGSPLNTTVGVADVAALAGGGLVPVNMGSSNIVRLLGCRVELTSELWVDQPIPKPKLTSCLAAPAANATCPRMSELFPADKPKTDALVVANALSAVPWRYPGGEWLKLHETRLKGQDPVSMLAAAPAFPYGESYIGGASAEAYKPSTCLCRLDGNIATGAPGKPTGVADNAQAGRVRIDKLVSQFHDNGTDASYTTWERRWMGLRLFGVQHLSIRGIDFVVDDQHSSLPTSDFDVPTLAPQPLLKLRTDGNGRHVGHLQLVGNRLLHPAHTAAWNAAWANGPLTTTAVLPRAAHVMRVLVSNDFVYDLLLARNAFCEPTQRVMTFEGVARNDARLHHKGLHILDNYVGPSPGKTFNIHRQSAVRETPTATTPLVCPGDAAADAKEWERGLWFSGNLIEGGFPWPCWGQWNNNIILHLGTDDLVTVGPMVPPPRPAVCDAADGMKPGSPWPAAPPSAPPAPTAASANNCVGLTAGLAPDAAKIAAVTGAGGNVIRRGIKGHHPQPQRLAARAGRAAAISGDGVIHTLGALRTADPQPVA